MADAALDAEPAFPLLALRSNRGRVALGATVGASAVASLDATIVSVALPQIGRDLDVDVAGLQWVLTGYLLTLASFILLGGALGDRFGRRRMFLIGSAWFGLASLGCAAAPSIAATCTTSYKPPRGQGASPTGSASWRFHAGGGRSTGGEQAST